MKVTAAIDSGAHSIYHKYSVNKAGWRDKVSSRGTKSNFKGRKNAERNYDFYATPEFDTYLDAYVEFVKDNTKKLDFYVTIDAIFNPELSLEIFKRLRKKGITPLPVLHPGEDPKWLKEYLEHTDYIGFGGVGQEWVRAHYANWVVRAFDYIKGKNIRVHGFAMSSFKLLHDFPWYSVDSTTPFYMARCGTLLVPKLRRINGKTQFNYLTPHVHMAITTRRDESASHVATVNALDKRNAEEYLEMFGYTFKEAQESAYVRGIVNYGRMNGLQTAINNELGREFRYYMSGAAHEGWKVFLNRCEKFKMDNVHFLGTHFAPKSLIELLPMIKLRRPSV